MLITHIVERGDFKRLPCGFRYEIEYHVVIDFYVDDRTVEMRDLTIEDVVIYPPPYYATGLSANQCDPNWRDFKREAESYLLGECREDDELQQKCIDFWVKESCAA